MSDLTFTQYDTAPSVYGTLSNITQVELEDATEIRFQMRLAHKAAFKVDAVASIEDAASLQVRYDWAAGDLSTPGEYIVRWKITFQDGTKEHTEPENTLTVEL